MDIHFINGVVGAFIIGFILGCALLGVVSRRAKRMRLRRDSSGYVAMSMACRMALQKLESGDTGAAKQVLSDHIANFYHSFKASSEHPQRLGQVITSERQQIEAQAQSSAILATALKSRLNRKSDVQ
jgi:hypothetical protein